MPIDPRGLAPKLSVEPATVGKLLVNLDRAGLIERAEASLVTNVHRRALLAGVVGGLLVCAQQPAHGLVHRAPRAADPVPSPRQEDAAGRDRVHGRAAGAPAATGTAMSLHLAALFTPDPAGLAAKLGLIKVGPETANVVIAAPFDPVLLTGGLGRRRHPWRDHRPGAGGPADVARASPG